MSQGQDHRFLAERILERIEELPVASEIAAEELRRRPVIGDTSKSKARMSETHGADVADIFVFYGDVIGRSDIFTEIRFGSEVEEAARNDKLQQTILMDIGRRNTDLGGNVARLFELKKRSARANKIYWAARLAVGKTEAEAPAPVDDRLLG